MAQIKQKKIIVAEDDVGTAEIVCRKLGLAGFKVRHAENGSKAIEMCFEDVPDIMLLDLMMPEVDGFMVLQKIRDSKDKKISSLPVIVLSNLWSNEDILKVQQLRADEYMVKAYFTPDEILAKISEVLAKKNHH